MILEGILPVYYEDPLAWLRPFKREDDSVSMQHWHEIVLLAVFYAVVYKISPVVGSFTIGKERYRGLKYKTRINFDVHIVSMVQCIISILAIVPMWNNPMWQNRAWDHDTAVLGAYPYGGFVGAISIGYFVWDLYVCLKHLHLFGVGFLFHAFAALFVFGSTLRPFCMPWIPGFLIFELSTPFVNINWFASRVSTGKTCEKVIIVNGILLLITFFSVRIVWGFYAVVLVAADMLATWGKVSRFFPCITLALNVLLDILNLFWFYKMLLLAKKKGKRTPLQTANEIADKVE